MTKGRVRRLWRTVLLPALLAQAGAGPASAETRLPVVTTFSVLADIVEQVGGEVVDVRSLVAAGGDVHVFRPGPHHARQLAAAGLVVSNGLGFEGWIDRLIRTSGYRGPVAVATRGIDTLPGRGHSNDAQKKGTDKRGPRSVSASGTPSPETSPDPHAWQSVPNMKRYVENIADALCEARAASCARFRGNAQRYSAVLEQLDREIRAAIAAVPAERRKVITSHDAFGYYAHEYGVQFLAPMGVSTDAEPSAAGVARLIRQIRAEGVNAFFVEGISDPRLIWRIRDETGGAEPGTLYSDGLSGPDGPAATYQAMMRYNTQAITAALSAPAAKPPAHR